MMKQSTCVFALVASTLVASVYAQTTIQYTLTVRDFLPRQCGPVRTNVQGNGNAYTTGSINANCPYQAEIAAGIIAGHPDFETGINEGFPSSFRNRHTQRTLSNGDIFGFIVSGDAGDDDISETTDDFTEIANSGLPKPGYCKSSEGFGPDGEIRCGCVVSGSNLCNRVASSNKTFFDDWYNDNIKYNRRVGVPLVLNQDPNDDRIFIYDSETDPENEFNTAAGGNDFYTPHAHLRFTEAQFPDPLTVPNWPKDAILTAECKNFDFVNRRLWHTTEVHTFFNYTGTEEFEFSGDDDVWVYLNGRKAVDLGSIHARQDQKIDLASQFAAEYFNMTIGGVYTFDMFQAERQCSRSNFLLTTSLNPPCNAANEANRKTQYNAATDQSEEIVKKSRDVVLNGDGSFILTNTGSPHSSSFYWIKEPINVGTGFIIDFSFKASGLTEGFAFVLHRREEGLTNLPLSGGPNFNFKGIENSLALVFDLCSDRDETNSTCRKNQISLHFPEEGQGNNPSDRTRTVFDPVMIPMTNDEEHTVKIEYFFLPPALEVTLDGSLYLRELPFDAIAILQSRAAFVGFTATAGEFDDTLLTISGLNVDNVDVEASNTQSVDFDTDPGFQVKTVLADGVEADGFSIQTFDGCGAEIEFGFRTENTQGIYVEEPDSVTGFYTNGSTTPNIVIIDEPFDDNSGKYKYNLQTLGNGVYSFYMYYGDPGDVCELSKLTSTVSVNGTDVDLVSYELSPASSPTDCFFGSVLNGVQMLPLTDAPTASPTPLVLPPVNVDETAGYVATVGGSVVGVCVAVAAFMAIAYRRKWQKEKAFIEEGQLYKLDAQTKFDPNDKLGVAGRDLLASRQAILRMRAQRGQDMSDLTKLENEQEELMEEIMAAKKALQIKQTSETFEGEGITPPRRGAPGKLEF